MDRSFQLPRDEAEKDFRWLFRLLTFLCAIGILLLACVIHRGDGPLTVPRPQTEAEYRRASIYVLQADAILKGQPWLALEPSEGLQALENPYDPAARRSVPYRWDFAYRDGRYYCYFGVAPVLLLYLPFYAVTGRFPTVLLANVVFSVAAVFCFAFLFWEFRRFLFPRAPRWLILFALPCMVCTVGIPYAVGFADMYYLPVISAMLFSFLFYGLLLRGLERRGTLQRVLFACAALALTLVVLSRPSAALMCMAAFPFGIWFLRQPQKKGEKLRGMLAFGVPLLVGAGAVMAWNAARFGSPLDFGATYQLTVSDISQNHLRPDLFRAAMESYFAPNLQFSAKSVLFEISPAAIRAQVYRDASCGVLAFPIVCGSVLSVFLCRPNRRGVARLWSGAVVLLAAILAWFDFCTGGVNLRYVLDILPALAVCGCVSALSFAGERRHCAVRTAVAILLAAVLAAGVFHATGVRVFAEFRGLFA